MFYWILEKRPEYSVSHSGEEWERVMARSRRDFLKQHTSNLIYILNHNLKDCWDSCTLISQFGSFLLSLATIHKPQFRSANWCTKLPSLWPSPPRTLQRPHLTTWQGVLFETIPAQGSLFPLSPLFPPWGPFGRGRELRWPHCADCSPASARCIPENWARLLLLLHNIPFYFVRFRHQLRSRRPRTAFHASRPNGQRSSFKKEKNTLKQIPPTWVMAMTMSVCHPQTSHVDGAPDSPAFWMGRLFLAEGMHFVYRLRNVFTTYGGVFRHHSLTATISVPEGSSVTFTRIVFYLTQMASSQFRWVLWVELSLHKPILSSPHDRSSYPPEFL